MKVKLTNGNFYKQSTFTTLEEKAEGKPLVAIVSTEDVDSDGDIIHQGPTDKGQGWQLDRFNKNPRIYWMHDPYRPNLALAKTWVKSKRLYLGVDFDKGDDFARELDRKYRDGILSEWSVGYVGKVAEPVEDGFGLHFYEQELHEVSAVNQGANPSTETIGKALQSLDPELIDTQEKQDLTELKRHIEDLREELDARLREVESSIMKGYSADEELMALKLSNLNAALGDAFKGVSDKQE